MLNKTRREPDAAELIEGTADNIKIDSAYLRMHSRDISDQHAARTLQVAANKLTRLSNALERLTRQCEKTI